jgi:hypothetical protein
MAEIAKQSEIENDHIPLQYFAITDLASISKTLNGTVVIADCGFLSRKIFAQTIRNPQSEIRNKALQIGVIEAKASAARKKGRSQPRGLVESSGSLDNGLSPPGMFLGGLQHTGSRSETLT